MHGDGNQALVLAVLFDLEQGQVAIVRNMLYASDVLPWVAFLLDGEKLRIGDDVCIRHQPIGRDDPAGTRSAALRTRQPGNAVVRFLGRVADSDHRFANLTRLGERDRAILAAGNDGEDQPIPTLEEERAAD